jgi:hypothetical protein
MEQTIHDTPDPRRFRIWVAGRLGEGFAEGIGGIKQQDTRRGTTLSGDLIDQSHIHGILDRLRELGVEVLRFEISSVGDEAARSETPTDEGA